MIQMHRHQKGFPVDCSEHNSHAQLTCTFSSSQLNFCNDALVTHTIPVVLLATVHNTIANPLLSFSEEEFSKV